MAAHDYPLGERGQIIGTPYQGTHAKAFNVKGGSNNWQSENAYDIKVPVGTPVYAVTGGTVSPPGYGFGPGGQGRFAGDRLHLVGNGNVFYYAHLSKLVVHPGEQVQAGQLLGYTGEADGVAHLHFAAEKGDPAAWLGGIPKGGTSDTTTAAPTGIAATPPAPPIDMSGTLPTVQAQPPDVMPSPADTQPYQAPPGSGPFSSTRYVQDLWSRIQATAPDTQQLQQNAQIIGG